MEKTTEMPATADNALKASDHSSEFRDTYGTETSTRTNPGCKELAGLATEAAAAMPDRWIFEKN